MATTAWPSDPLRGRRLGRPSLVVGACGAAGAIAVGAGAGFGPVAGLAALVAVLGGLVVVERPAVGALALAGLAPVLSGLRRGLPVPGLRVSEILVVGLAGLVLVAAPRSQLRPWRALDLAALAYVVATLALGAVDVLAFDRPADAETARTLLAPLQYLVLYRAVLVGLPGATERARALAFVLTASVPVSALALLQHFNLLGVRDLLANLTGTDIFAGEGGGARATSTFPHWQVLAAYAWWIVLLAVALLLDDAQRVLRRETLVVVLGLALAAAVATSTLATLVGAVVGALALALRAGHLRRVVVGILLASALVALAFGGSLQRRVDEQFSPPPGSPRPAWVPQTVDYRIELWRAQIIPTLSGHWLTGYGPDLPASARFPYTESLYMTLLLHGGVVLLGVYLLLALALLAVGLRARDGPEDVGRAAGRVLVVGVVLLAVMHLFEPYFLNTGMAHLLWITAALAAAAAPARPGA